MLGEFRSVIQRWAVTVPLALLSVLLLGSSSQAYWSQPSGGGDNEFGQDLEAGALAPSTSGAASAARAQQVCHDVSNLWLLVSNFGVFGNPSETYGGSEYTEVCGHPSYISCQFPAHSGFDYLFQGALWIAGISGDDTLVSVGHDGWAWEKELWPGSNAEDTVRVYTNNPTSKNYDPVLGVADQSFVAVYTDTLLTSDDPDVSPNHRKPLNIRIEQTSHALSYSYAEDFVIFDYEIANLGLKTLKDVYVGIYLDGDVGPVPRNRAERSARAQDDLTGFRRYSQNQEINAAWLADYDGALYRTPDKGDAVLVPGVMGVRVLRSPAKELRTLFNWWLSDSQQDVDWGPGRPFPDGLKGTPDGDVNKYLIMNGWQNATLPDSTTDPDQLYAVDGTGSLVGPEDTRFLFSFGPFQIAPSEVLPFTLGYFCADHFWQGGVPGEIDFKDFDLNAEWVQFVFDNPGVDTPNFDYGDDGIPNTQDAGEGDGVLDSGDWFYGEDVGLDGVPGTGDFGEGNSQLDSLWVDGQMRSEDRTLAYAIRWIDADPTGAGESPLEYLARISGSIDWSLSPATIMEEFDRLRLGSETRFGHANNRLDEGDGFPDFSGPPPPPSPQIKLEKSDASHVVVKWGNSSEGFVDSFIQEPNKRRDFQGYRIHVSRTGAGSDFSVLLDLDIDRVPIYDDAGEVLAWMADSLGRNTGFDLVRNTDADSSDYPYRYEYGPTLSNWPLFLAVTAYDNGYPAAGLASLESSIFASSTQVTPSTPLDAAGRKPVRAVPNPYRITTDYRGGWEIGAEAWTEFDRRMVFTNLPGPCTVEIFTVAGDLVEQIRFDPGDADESLVDWDLLSRNGLPAVAGLYLFAVRPDDGGKTQVGKFVILK